MARIPEWLSRSQLIELGYPDNDEATEKTDHLVQVGTWPDMGLCVYVWRTP